MPSKSKSQQRFFGMVDAYKKGELKNPGSKVKKAAKGMSMDDVKDFAETKHKGLPEKVEENMKKQVIRMTESDLHQLVKESVNKVLKESEFDAAQQKAEKIGEFIGYDEAYHHLIALIANTDGAQKVMEYASKLEQMYYANGIV